MAVVSKPLRSIPPGARTPLLALLTALLLVRSRLWKRRRSIADVIPRATRLSAEELAQATQELYVQEADGSKTLLLPFRGQVKRVNIVPTPPEQFAEDAKRFPPLPDDYKPSVDKRFLRQLLAIMRVAFPSWKSREAGILVLHSFFLVLRTLLSVAVAKLDGRIVRDLVSADGKGFLKGLGWWFALSLPSTYTNAMIRHLQSKLSLHVRTRLIRYTHDLYLSAMPDLRFYRVTHESGLDAVDQYITSDIAAFSESLAALYGNVGKPSLDMLIFTAQLSRSIGFRGTVMLFLNYYITARILRAATPAFGRLAAVEARLEGEYRAGMGRVGRESEEVAFYNGGVRERDILWRAYLRLVKHINSIYKIRIAYEWTEDFVIKYLWSAAGYCLISIPVLFTRRRSVGVQVPTDAKPDNAVANRTENYISSRRLLLSLADAGGRLMYAYKDVLELAGLTTRLYTLLSTLHAIPALPPFVPSADTVSFTHLDVAVPNDDLTLVRDLNFELKMGEGEHLLVTGSNGVGKTSVARVIAGLWAAAGGTVARPPGGVSGVFVVPQRSYMVYGSLLDQMIYPHSYAQFKASGRTFEEMMEILHAVHLAYLPEREGGWSTIKEWRDVLSGGEKQRMALARVFYHKPKFAVLDECTSAVSSDVEGSMYEALKSKGITLITISLRPSLTKYHTHLLTLSGDGTGGWALTRVGTAEERMGLDREMVSLEGKLADVGRWEARVKELDRLLHESEL